MAKIIVVGAGLGGLAAALRIAHEGYDVEVFEKTDRIGGRNFRVRFDGFDFDGGPTLLMMLDPFRKLFADVGEDLAAHLDLRLCDPLYRVFFADGSRIDATTRQEEMSHRLAQFSPRDAKRLPRFLADLRTMYEESIPAFVERNYTSPLDFFGPKPISIALRHGLLGNLAKRVDRYFSDPRVRMLFGFQSMYLGISPFEAPWVYATLAHMEFGEGIWYPKGGIPAISAKIADLAVARGARIHLREPVERITSRGVVLESGREVLADAVLCNADLPYAKRNLLGKRLPNWKYSCSAQVRYLAYQGSIPEILHHNVFFGADFRGNLEDIFTRGELPSEPAFYASISARTDPSRAPAGHENLFLLTPCPNLATGWNPTYGERLDELVYDRLESETGFRRENIVASRSIDPPDWKSDLNLEVGAAFGLSHHLTQSAYFRPANFDRRTPNVYFVGASTAPGNGMPMVLISADLAVQRLRENGVIK